MMPNVCRESTRWLWLGILCFGCCAVPLAEAQDQRLPSSRLTSGPAIRELLRPVIAPVRAATVTVISEGETVALGLVVRSDGWIVTKASELKATAVCEWSDGTRRNAEIRRTMTDFDVALLKVDARNLPAVDVSRTAEAPVGVWAITVGTGQDPVAVGVISTPPRSIPATRGVLGISIMDDEGGAEITQIYPNSSADRAGLKVGDVIRQISGQAVRNRANLSQVLRSFRPGDALAMQVVRGDKQLDLRAVLGYPLDDIFSRTNFQNVTGGALSQRRDGFPQVLIHDTQLSRSLCGGPLVDLDGRLLGLNIARATRTDTYSVPPAHLRRLVAELPAATDAD